MVLPAAVIGKYVRVLRYRRIGQQLQPDAALLAHGVGADGGRGGVQLLAQLGRGLAGGGFLPKL
jgi:hypothetical protein